MEDKTKIYIDQRRAMTQALEALENSIDLVEEDYANAVNLYGKYQARLQRLIGMETMRDDHRKAITALREALAEPQEKYIYGTPLLDAMTGKANEALDKMAENARELGLDYEPRRWAVFCQGCRKEWNVSYPHPGKSICADCDDKLAEQPAQQEPVAWKLVPREPTHEMLKAMDECSTEGYDERLYAGHASSVYMAAVDAAPTPPAQRKPLTDEEIILIVAECAASHQHTDIHFARAIERAHGIKELV